MTVGGIALAETQTDYVAASLEKAATLKGYDAKGGEGRSIYEVPVQGTIDLGLASFIERVVKDASAQDVVFLRMNTFGGRVDAAVRIRDALLNADGTTVIFVEGRAISAGALIALACDTIIMSPGATIGDAMPIQLGGGGEGENEPKTSEKAISYMREEMAATAKAKGRPAELARAMVDPDLEVKGVDEKGKLLTLAADDAVRLELAEAMAPDFEAAVALLNLNKGQRVAMDTHWAEKIARVLTDPIISSLLMTFGVLGLLVEFYTPGFGAAGIAGIVCLTLFFLGQYAAHLAGWEELLLLVIGLGLIGVEVFFLPGHGVMLAVGSLMAGAAIVMALVELDLPLDVSFDLGYFQEAATRAGIHIAILMVVVVVATGLLFKYFPETRLGQRVILSTEVAASAGYVSQVERPVELVGKRGVAHGMLRPAGIAEIEGRRVDVVSVGEYIKPGTAIEVVAVDGNRVVVKQVS
jgi:membrane-bound serine protease (ClpP class)